MEEIKISLGTILWIFSSLSVIIGTIEAIRLYKTKRGFNFKVRLDEHDKKLLSMDEDIAELNNKISLIDPIANGIRSLLRSQMVDTYNRYHKVGSIPMWVKNSFDDCFINYKSLGGNGFMDNIHEIIINMPLTEDNDVTKSD